MNTIKITDKYFVRIQGRNYVVCELVERKNKETEQITQILVKPSYHVDFQSALEAIIKRMERDELLKPEVTKISYDTWIMPLDIRSIDGNHIVFTANSEFQKDFIENKYRSLIFNTLRYITNKEWTFSVIDLSKEENTNQNIIADKNSNVSDAELETNHQTVDPKSLSCHSQKLSIVSDKKCGKRNRKELGDHSKHQSPASDQAQAFLEQVFQFIVVAGTVMEADDRSTSDGIAKEDRNKYEVDIHNGSISGNTVFAGKSHKLDVI